MKPQSRIMGVDDAPFRFGDEKTTVVCAVVRIPSYLEALMVGVVEVDGADADDVLLRMLRSSRYTEGLSLVLIDGVALGGFNVVDIDRLHKEVGVPFATVTRDSPDIDSMVEAVRKRFSDWERRAEVIRRKRIDRIKTQHKPLYVTHQGMTIHELKEAVSLSTVRGALPEPLRIAHLVATAIARGESHGRA